MTRGAAPLIALALAVGCSDPREAELAQELAALQEGRTATTSFERMRADADAGEAAAAALQPELDALAAQIEEGAAALRLLEGALEAEIARNVALNQSIKDGQLRLQQAAARQAELEQRVAIRRARAQTFRDQAAALAKELRPDDPDWARRLRLRSLREFLHEVGEAWPRDPVLAEAAGSALPADDREAMRVGSALAERIRDRVAEVYELTGERAEAAEPAVAAGRDGS